MSKRSRRIGRVGRVYVVLALLVAAGCGGGPPQLSGDDFELPETAVRYSTDIVGMPDEDMAELASETLLTYRYQDRGAFSLPMLRRRAENDIETVEKILRSHGYYNGTVEVVVEEVAEEEFEAATAGFEFPSLSDLMFWKEDPSDRLEEVAEQFAHVVFTVEPGPQFTLARHDFQFIDPEAGAAMPPAQALGSPVGEAARAVPIVAAEAAAETLLEGSGFPYAEIVDRDAVADLELATVEVDTQLFSGPAAVFGPVEFIGLEDVEEDYLRTYIPWQPGEVVDREEIRVFTRSLLATDLFETAVVTIPPEAPDVDGPIALPVVVTAKERPFRTVSAGAEYSTDEGPAATFGFEHRNLWGENQTVRVDADLALDLQALRAAYREPQFRRPGQDFVGTLALVHEEDDAFDETRATVTAGLKRRLSPQWVVGYGGLLEASRVTDNGVDTDAFLAGIPTYAEYDGTDDLLNPTEGARARFNVTPFVGTVDEDFTSFLLLDNHGSAYWDIMDDDEYVLAGRVRLASIVAAELNDVPKNRRLYAGGGGSVRGYENRTVGPLDAEGDPVGGLSAVELNGEIRANHLWGDLGGVLFVDAGTVSTESWPDFDQGMQVAAGVGIRYLSIAGPIRLDVAFPVNPRPVDDAFQLYFSIGQAF